MSTATAEVEAPDLTQPEPNLPAKLGPGAPLIERWLVEGKDKAIERIETLVDVLDRMRKASIRATTAPDWIIHTSTDGDGTIIAQRGYLQDTGAQRAGKVWGIEIGSPAIEREDFPDNTFAYHMIAEAYSKVTGERLEYVEGSRWSGDPFFKRSVGPDDKVDPVDVRKSAYSNLAGGAVRRLAGLNGVPLDMLRECGIDITKVIGITYAKGAKGGESTGAGAGAGSGIGVVIPFGKYKNQHASDLPDKELKDTISYLQKQVADVSKEKYRPGNERLLAGLEKEVERRKNPTPPPDTSDKPAPSGTLAQRKTAQFKRLSQICTEHNAAVPAVLEELTGARTLGDVTEEKLNELCALSDDDLMATAIGVGGRDERE